MSGRLHGKHALLTGAAVFLASAASSCMTAQTLHRDGGKVMS